MSEKRGTLRKVAEGHEDHGADESFRLLVDSVRDYAIFMLDPTGHVMTWNLGAERTKGYTADEIIGRHFSTFYTEEDKDRHLRCRAGRRPEVRSHGDRGLARA